MAGGQRAGRFAGELASPVGAFAVGAGQVDRAGLAEQVVDLDQCEGRGRFREKGMDRRDKVRIGQVAGIGRQAIFRRQRFQQARHVGLAARAVRLRRPRAKAGRARPFPRCRRPVASRRASAGRGSRRRREPFADRPPAARNRRPSARKTARDSSARSPPPVSRGCRRARCRGLRRSRDIARESSPAPVPRAGRRADRTDRRRPAPARPRARRTAAAAP